MLATKEAETFVSTTPAEHTVCSVGSIHDIVVAHHH